MFKPRHAYKSPITNRYRGKAKGCPVFNNLNEITSDMVEQHDECLECLANIKNRTDLYKTLADNNKPSNNVIKSLQRLSSSASNNRLKTCLQFLIIKVNEKSVSAAKQTATNGTGAMKTTSIHHDHNGSFNDSEQVLEVTPVSNTLKHLTKRQKSHHYGQQHQRQLDQHLQTNQKINQLASPPQDQVSSTQDQVGTSQDDHDCQTSPMMPIVSSVIEDSLNHHEDEIRSTEQVVPVIQKRTTLIKGELVETGQEEHEDENEDGDQDEEEEGVFAKAQSTLSSLKSEYALEATTMTTSTSPDRIIHSVDSGSSDETSSKFNLVNMTQPAIPKTATKTSSSASTTTSDMRSAAAIRKRRKTQNSINSDHETSSIASWSSASFGGTSPPSPLSSASSTSSISSSSSHSSSSSCSSSSPSLSPSRSLSPLSSPDFVNELREPRLKLSEEKIRKIRKRPVLFDDIFYATNQPPSFASTPTASSGCSPGQHSNATQNSDQSSSTTRSGFTSSSTSNLTIHMFQAPPTFVNTLKPCNLPTLSKQQQQHQAKSPSNGGGGAGGLTNPPAAAKIEMLNCAICGIKDKVPNISRIHGQNSCLLCTKFFASFLKRPQQLYCAQDGDCLMTFDSRCQACWIKICLQKFDIDEEHRKVGHKYSPKLLSSPSVSLITIDTSTSS